MSEERSPDLSIPNGRHWGEYPSAAQLPNVSGAAAQVRGLRLGEVASVLGVLYRCTSAARGAAAWEKIPVTADIPTSYEAARGEMYITASAETTIDAQNTPKLAAGTYAAGPDLTAKGWTVSAAGRLTYTGTENIFAHIAASFSMTAAGNNKLLSVYVAKNGTVLTASRMRRLVGTGADEGTGAVHAACDMVTDDYLEFYVENNTDAVNMTLTLGNMFAMGMMRG